MNKMILPRGITGFWRADTEISPILDEKAFRRMCHALIRENGGTLEEVDTDTVTRNFYSAKISRYGQSVFLLQNIHYLWAAFARWDDDGRYVFIAPPEWLCLPEGMVRFLSPDELNQEWHGHCQNLSLEELGQIRYWKPQTVGEIIFNTWD